MDSVPPSSPRIPTPQQASDEPQFPSVHFSSGGSVRNLQEVTPQLPESEDRHHLRPRSFRSYRVSHPRESREHIQLTYKPLDEDESGRFFIDPGLFSSRTESLEFESLTKAFNTINHEERVKSGDSENPLAGTGAIAARAFKENELIGFYQGHLVRRKKLPELWRGDYKRTFIEENETEFVWPQYALWKDEGNSIEFLSGPDTYIAWTGINIYGCGEEIGVDGVEKANALSFLNHRDDPNATLQPVINPKAMKHVLQDRTQHLQADQVSAENVLLAMIATEDIPEGAEITFCYGNKVDFNHVGADVMTHPQQCMNLKGGRLKFLQPKDWNKGIYDQQVSPQISDSASSDVYSYASSEDEDEQPLNIRHNSRRKGYRFPDDSSEDEGVVETTSSSTNKTKATKRAARPQIKRIDHGKRRKLQDSPKAAHILPGILYLKRYLGELSPEEVQSAKQGGEALKRVTSHIWGTLDKRRTLNNLASMLNALDIEDENTGDWWDSSSAYDYMCKSGLLKGDDTFIYMPLPVLKECSDEDPEIVKKFIKVWIESGKYIPALRHKLNEFDVTIPTGRRRRLWDVNVIKECCPDVSLSEAIKNIRTKIDELGGPAELAKNSKVPSALLSIIRMSNNDEALCEYIVINYFAPEHEPRMIARKLKQAKIDVPGRKDYNWGTNDVIRYLIDHDVVDLSDPEQLIALPVEAVMALEIPDLLKAQYIIEKINSRAMPVASLIHSWSRSGTLNGKKSNLYGLVQLLLPHLSEINFERSIDKLEETYERELTSKRKNVKNPRAVNPVVREVSSELMLRCALEGTPGLRRYIQIMCRNGKRPSDLTTPLGKTGIPVPVEFQDEDDISDNVIWGSENIKKGLTDVAPDKESGEK